jgi:hypothetical protein
MPKGSTLEMGVNGEQHHVSLKLKLNEKSTHRSLKKLEEV